MGSDVSVPDHCLLYISSLIQNEIIDTCGGIIQQDIVAACNNVKYFGLIAHEATDAATMEQMAICVFAFRIYSFCETKPLKKPPKKVLKL